VWIAYFNYTTAKDLGVLPELRGLIHYPRPSPVHVPSRRGEEGEMVVEGV